MNVMKKKSSNAVVNYDPVQLSEAAAVHFTRTTDASGTTIYGKIVKEGAEVGNVAYSSKGGYMNTSLKPFSALTEGEVKSLYAQVPDCISEVLSEA